MPKTETSHLKNSKQINYIPVFFVALVASVFSIFAIVFASDYFSVRYDRNKPTTGASVGGFFSSGHLKTPESVKAVYMTACIASSPLLRKKVVELIDNTEINSLVIDVKDYSGTVSIPLRNDILKTKKNGCFINDAKEFIDELHNKGIYIIGRISVFQDPYYANLHPELAVLEKNGEKVWRDRKGLSFIDVSAKPYWEYIVAIAREANEIGFDELNFDYIRFPSDGDMENIIYPWTGQEEKKEALRKFFGYLKKRFRDTGAVLSADLFGMTTTNEDDLNIGQYLEYTLPYFDFVAPMVYPSHYPPDWNGYANPATVPYEVIRYSLDRAYFRSSTTPEKIRPWLQDFNLGANYTADMVRAQIKAVYDSGFDSWMIWSPSNRYTEAAFDKEVKLDTGI